MTFYTLAKRVLRVSLQHCVCLCVCVTIMKQLTVCVKATVAFEAI